MELALDLALQCAPDHPWLATHPEWFQHRPDGSLKYAENPPKRYQDIHNLDWETADQKGLWKAVRDVVLRWCELGVTVFRVDNPHTKPVPFWEWLMAEVRKRHPGTVFLSEAFTRPAMMTLLAKAGFSQSYTYFTWKNTKGELVDFVEQLRSWSTYLRPNLWPNTPDILHALLQTGGRPAFEFRLVLAATLSPSYGIYSGYEAARTSRCGPGARSTSTRRSTSCASGALDGPLLPLVRRLNELRRAHPALTGAGVDQLTWLETEREHLLAYARALDDDVVLGVVNLDPFSVHDGVCVVPPSLGLPEQPRGRRRAHRRDLRVGRAELRPARPGEGARDGGAPAVTAHGEEGVATATAGAFRGLPRRSRGSSGGNPLPRIPASRAELMSEHWFEAQPNWFKTAVFYELHTRAFFDSSDDGMGDFRGLRSKLDYLQWLGIDCIWLLPFYPSPLRDGGYDVSDFLTVRRSSAPSTSSRRSSRRHTSAGCA